MNNRINISSMSPWEDIVGYSRAVRIGNVIEISGTTAVNDEEIVGGNNLYLQTRYILQKVQDTLEQSGSELKDVIRTRMYVTNIADWENAAKAHSEFFGSIRPASTLIEVNKLIHPDLLIEIEVSAIVQG